VALSGGPIVNAASRPLGEDIIRSEWLRPGVSRRRDGDTAWKLITKPDSGGGVAAYMWPQLLEGGQSVLYTRMGPSGMWHDSRIVLEDLTSGERTTVASEGTYGRYVPTGHVVYIRDDGTVAGIEPGNGLRGMRERVEQLGGWLSLAVEQGVALELRLPLEKE
jgi:hypothetical protein